MRSNELRDMNTQPEVATTIPLGAFPAGLSVPVPDDSSSPLGYAEAVGEAYLSFSGHNQRKNGGHYADACRYSKIHGRALHSYSGLQTCAS